MYLACTCDVPVQVSALIYPAGVAGGQPAPGGTAGQPGASTSRVQAPVYGRDTGRRRGRGGIRCRPGRALARAARYAALAAVSALVPGSPAASGAEAASGVAVASW